MDHSGGCHCGNIHVLLWLSSSFFGHGFRPTTRSLQFTISIHGESKVMREFVGKAAFVTGGASGIGWALSRAFAEAGCKVMLADIEKTALDGRWRASQVPGGRYEVLSATLPILLP